MRRTIVFALLPALLALASCTYPVRNEAITSGERAEYGYDALGPDRLGETLIVVTASGGGTRAASLAMSVLKAMDKVRLRAGGTLAEEVDILSSVSGGSVAAAYFAMRGRDGFADFDREFLQHNGMSALLGSGLAQLPALATPSRERIDILIDYFDERLFKSKTYGELIERRRRPYLILNAADMVEGSPFPFTQYTMDLLCSDLAKMKLSTAVAASAAFPVAFSPVTLTNYRPCDTRRKPGWLENDTPWYFDPPRVMWQRTAAPYAEGDRKKFIHLLDGGIADNLGVAEPFRLLTSEDASPLLRQRIAQGRIKKIVFVLVNARSAAPSDLDGKRDTPGIVDMLASSIYSALDRATFNMAERLRTLLTEFFMAQANNRILDRETRANFATVARNTYLIPIDFHAIDDPKCRVHYHSIGTNWALPADTLASIDAIGEALIANHPQFRPMLTAVGAVDPALPMLSVEQACATVKPKS